jgi:phosphoglycolate phosphatase-like HAD superfamily hydrolase
MGSIIFDFDGVLGNTFEPSIDFLRKYFKISKNRAEKILIKDGLKNKPDKFLKRLVRTWYYQKFLVYLKKYENNLLFQDKLQELKNIDCKKAILTRNETSVCKQSLGEWQNEFEAIMGRDNSKSKIDGFNKICDLRGFQKTKTIFVTDSIGDVLEMLKVLPPEKIILVSWGFQPVELLQKHLPHQKIINSFLELKEDLENL